MMKFIVPKAVHMLVIGFFIGVLVDRNLPPRSDIQLAFASPVDASVASLPTALDNTHLSDPLPAFKWPQKDYTIRNAIEEGIRIHHEQIERRRRRLSGHEQSASYYDFNGSKCESPPKGLATVVTAMYDMPSKHSGDQYRGWFDMMLAATDPMIVFLDPDSSWVDFVTSRRQHAPTIIALVPFKNLTMSSVFTDTFWKNEVFPLDDQKRFKKGVDVYKIWNEKMIMMHETAMLNPYDTEHFFWIDAGYFRKKFQAPKYTPIIRNNISANGIEPYQVIYSNPFQTPDKYEIAAGAWGGTQEAILLTYDRYFETFWYMVLNKIPCAGYEQHVQTIMCKSFPSLCRIVFSNGDWFLLGRSLLRNEAFSFDNKTSSVLIGSPNETLVQLPLQFPQYPIINASTRIS